MNALIAHKPLTVQFSGKVYLSPTNEGHEMPYSERVNGTQSEILKRAVQMLDGLKTLLPCGDWKIKIESSNAAECLYVCESFIYDSEFNVLQERK